MTRRACQLEQLQEIFGPLCILIGTQAYSYFWKWGQLTNLFVFVQRNPVQLDSICNKPNSSRKWFILSYGPYRKHKSQFQIINQTNDRAIPRFFSQFPLAVLRACKGGCLTHEFKEKTTKMQSRKSLPTHRTTMLRASLDSVGGGHRFHLSDKTASWRIQKRSPTSQAIYGLARCSRCLQYPVTFLPQRMVRRLRPKC